MNFNPSMPLAVKNALNPFTLGIPLAIIVCYSNTFENNLGIKQKFTKYLKESCCMASDQHFSFKFFPQNALVCKIFPKSSGLFLAVLSVNELIYNFGGTFVNRACFRKYVKMKCCSYPDLQLFFKYFVNLCFIPKLF